MKKPDKLNNWIKQQIEDNPQLPPEAAWEQISENLDLENAWQGINQDLELDNLRTKIDNRLHVCAQMMWWERAGTLTATVLAAMVILLPLLWQVYGPEQALADNIPVAQTIARQAEETASSQGFAEEVDVQPKDKNLSPSLGTAATDKPREENNTLAEHTAVPADRPTSAAIDSAPVLKEKAADAAPALASTEKTAKEVGLVLLNGKIIRTTAAGFNNAYSLLHYPATGLAAMLQLKEAALPKPSFISGGETVVNNPKKAQQANYWRVGVGASARASWLLNQKTYKALDKASLTTSLPAYRKSFSLLAEKSLTPRLALMTDLAVHSETGQRYLEYQSGTYGTTDTKLRYSHLNLLMAYRTGRVQHVKKPHMRLLAGITGGLLHEATLVTPLSATSLTEDYKPLTAALVLGYEYNQLVLPRVWMSYGFRGHIDVFNSYAGSNQIPAAFLHTRNSFLDFTIGFKYDLMNK